MAHSGLYYQNFTLLQVLIKGKTVDKPSRTRYVLVDNGVETLDFLKDNMSAFLNNVIQISDQEVSFADKRVEPNCR